MTQLDEKQLVEQAQAGDFDAFDQLVTLHERRLYALAWQLTQNHHDAQDAVQSALLAVVERFDTFRGEASFGTWATRITVNQTLKLLRRRSAQRTATLDGDGTSIEMPQYIAEWHDPQQALDRQELRQVLEAGIADLPQGQRLVFVLRDVQGMSVAETAEMLGLSESNVKVRLLRARLGLREYLTRRFGDERTRRVPDHTGHDHDSLLAMLRGKDDSQADTGAPR